MGGFPIMLLAAALASQTAPAAPQPAPAPPTAARTVSIPFAPPLGRTLNYRLTSTETRGGQAQTMTLDMRVVFRRDGAGYVISATYNLPPGIPRSHPMVAVLLRPLELRLDADGEIVGMVDEPAYWAAIDGITDDIIRSLGADPRGAEAVRNMFRAMRAMPDEERLALVARNVIPLFEYAGFEMEVGETRQGISDTESPFGPITQEFAVTLESAEGDTARMRSVVRLAPGQIERLMRAIQERFGASAVADAGAAAAQLPPERIETYEVSLRTGLTGRYTQSIGVPTAPGALPAPPGQTRTMIRLP
jgi:hypothetical protein